MTADTFEATQREDGQLSEVMLQVIAFTVLTLCGFLMYFLMTDTAPSLLPANKTAVTEPAERSTQAPSPGTVEEFAATPLPTLLPSREPVALPGATEVLATGTAVIASATRTPVAAQTEADKPLFGDAVYFNFASFELTAAGRTKLDGLAAKMRDYPASNLVLKGHADARGNADANAELSAARAQACENYLIAAGIDTARMGYASLGARRPRASNSTAVGRAENRRVDLVVLR